MGNKKKYSQRKLQLKKCIYLRTYWNAGAKTFLRIIENLTYIDVWVIEVLHHFFNTYVY